MVSTHSACRTRHYTPVRNRNTIAWWTNLATLSRLRYSSELFQK
jgi:hypothetical protein